MTKANPLFWSLLALGIVFVSCTGEDDDVVNDRTVSNLNFLNEYVLAADADPNGTVIGGISGIDYDANTDNWYMISDDQGSFNEPRYYTAKMLISSIGIQDIDINNTVRMLQPDRSFYNGAADPEAIRFDPDDNLLYWTSEGFRANETDPFLQVMKEGGSFVRSLRVPNRYRMNADVEIGPRNNGVFEGLTFNASGSLIYTMMELPLYQDGPAPNGDPGIYPVRISEYNKILGRVTREWAYHLDPVAEPGSGFQLNGTVEILAINAQEFLVLERSFTAGIGNFVKVYKISIADATDVSSVDALEGASYTPVSKELLVTINDLDLDNPVDNLEGMCWGPILPNGNETLVIVSDDNFSAFDPQVNQFLIFEVTP